MRRSLRRLVEDGMLIAIGEAGPGEPTRYAFSPMIIAMQGDMDRFKAAGAMISVLPGGEAALDKSARMMMGPKDG